MSRLCEVESFCHIFRSSIIYSRLSVTIDGQLKHELPLKNFAHLVPPRTPPKSDDVLSSSLDLDRNGCSPTDQCGLLHVVCFCGN